MRSPTTIDLSEETEICKSTRKPGQCCIGGKVLSEWLTTLLAIGASSNAGTDTERATCHGHDLGHLQREDEEDEDEEDEMQRHRCKQ